MSRSQQANDSDIRAAAGERDMIAALVETQMKIARGLTMHGLIAGVAIALGVPIIVLNLAPVNEWMPWVVVCSAAITGTGIIITTLAVVIVSYFRISRCLMKLLERERAPQRPQGNGGDRPSVRIDRWSGPLSVGGR